MLTNYRRLVVLAILPIVVGVAVILGELMWASYRTRVTWPLVTGTVTSNQTLSGKGKHGETTYGVGLAVEYVRNGRPFVGKAQTFIWTADRQEHLENLQRYPPGTKLQVRYNPNDPTHVRLSPDLIESVPTSVVVGILFLGTALGLLFVRGLRAKQSAEELNLPRNSDH